MKVYEVKERGEGWFQNGIGRVLGYGRDISYWFAKWVG